MCQKKEPARRLTLTKNAPKPMREKGQQDIIIIVMCGQSFCNVRIEIDLYTGIV